MGFYAVFRGVYPTLSPFQVFFFLPACEDHATRSIDFLQFEFAPLVVNVEQISPKQREGDI